MRLNQNTAIDDRSSLSGSWEVDTRVDVKASNSCVQ
jgi:hypothetical protein